MPKIPLEFVCARTRYYQGKPWSKKRMAQEIGGWLHLKEIGASDWMMNLLLERVLRAFKEKDAKFFRLVADALEDVDADGDDAVHYIFVAFGNLYLPKIPPSAPLPEVSAESIIEEAKRIWKAKRRGQKPPYPWEAPRWSRELKRCGLGA